MKFVKVAIIKVYMSASRPCKQTKITWHRYLVPKVSKTCMLFIKVLITNAPMSALCPWKQKQKHNWKQNKNKWKSLKPQSLSHVWSLSAYVNKKTRCIWISCIGISFHSNLKNLWNSTKPGIPNTCMSVSGSRKRKKIKWFRNLVVWEFQNCVKFWCKCASRQWKTNKRDGSGCSNVYKSQKCIKFGNATSTKAHVCVLRVHK